jgi:hypothetical protein
MKRNASLLVILVAVFSAVLFLSFKNGIIIDELAINALIPEADYKMKEVSGKTVSLNDIKKAKGLLVIFSCNTCPYVKMSESRIKEYSDFDLTNGV